MSRKGDCRKYGKQGHKAVDYRSGGSSSNQRSNANGNQTAKNGGNGGNNSNNNNYCDGANHRNGSSGRQFVPQSERTCYQCDKKTMMMIYRHESKEGEIYQHESKEGDQLIGTRHMTRVMMLMLMCDYTDLIQ
jgi:hypothetical protein